MPPATRPWNRGHPRASTEPEAVHRLTVYRPPPYSHELSPVEPVWAHLKRSLANLTKHTITELTALVKTRLRRMQYRPALLAGFLTSTGLEFGPFP
jgi:transposase